MWNTSNKLTTKAPTWAKLILGPGSSGYYSFTLTPLDPIHRQISIWGLKTHHEPSIINHLLYCSWIIRCDRCVRYVRARVGHPSLTDCLLILPLDSNLKALRFFSQELEEDWIPKEWSMVAIYTLESEFFSSYMLSPSQLGHIVLLTESHVHHT